MTKFNVTYTPPVSFVIDEDSRLWQEWIING